MMRCVRTLRRPMVAALLACLFTATSWAQMVVVPAPAATQPQATPQPQAHPEPPKWPDFNQVTKDMTPIPGLFTLYRYNPQDNSKDQTRLLCQIPRGLMKQDLLLATSISRGPQAGFQWEDYLIRFELLGKAVVVSVPDARFVTRPDQPVGDAVSRTYNDAFLAALPIVTMAPTGDPVVDLGQALLQPLVSLPGGMFMGMGGPSGGGAPRKDLSSFPKIKVFPDNALIDADLALGGRGGAGTTVGLTYSFRRLPALGSFQPRLADERIGYFTTVRQDWGAKHSERENLIRYVNRWDVKKKDASLELSPPEKPITFIIEKTVPLQWRKYVAEGILEWNKAYEKLGIVGAIVVQQQTDDNEFANVDPEDARYNFIRWIVTGRGFAMGPSRADPRTGQILDADIIFDDAMLRFFFREFQTFGPAPVAAIMGPEFTRFLVDNPQFIPMGQTLDQVKEAASMTTGELLQDAPAATLAAAADAASTERTVNSALLQRRLSPARGQCNYAVGMRQQMAVAQMAASVTGKKIPDRFMGEVIREVIAHEVGHTIGLRHNFKASAWLTEAEIKRRRDTTDEPLVASVMDYNPVVYFAGDQIESMRHIMTPCIGPYDYWAIEYGYKQPAAADGDEKTMLGKIAAQSAKREYAYATDEDTTGLSSVDPLVNRFDLSDDAVAWAKSRVALSDSLLKDFRKWAIKPNDPNHYLRSYFMTVLHAKTNNALYVSRLVGGQYFSRNRLSDPDAKPALQLVEPKRQRDALNSLEQTVFRDDFFAVEADLYNDLVASRWWDWASTASARIDFPVHQTIGGMQAYALMVLCSPAILQRVYDAELKTKAEDKFTAAELVSRTRNIVWGNLSLADPAKYTDAKPMISSLRRNLQRQHVAYLLAISESKPGSLVSADLHSMITYSLRDLSEQIAKLLTQAGPRLDLATKAHLSETRQQIERTLNAPILPAPQMGGGGMIILGQPAGQ